VDQLTFDDAAPPEVEEWRPVVGYEGLYEVSALGRVKSFWYSAQGVILRTSRHPCGYPQVSLSSTDGAKVKHLVHAIVAEAFIGHRPDGEEVRHLDGNTGNPRRTNLAYGTHSENMLDMRLHGTNRNAQKTHCPRNHEYNAENTSYRESGGRDCIPCSRIRAGEAYARKKRLGREGAAA